jgi:hypothetical protein
MSARFRVLVAEQDLLDHLRANPPAGWIVGDSRPSRPPYTPTGYYLHEVDIHDERAPADLDGCLVEPTLQRDFATGEVSVQSYRVVQPKVDCGPYVCAFPSQGDYRPGQEWTCPRCGATYRLSRPVPQRWWRNWWAPLGHWRFVRWQAPLDYEEIQS